MKIESLRSESFQARQKDATAGEMRLGQEMADHLQKLITPFFLRRTKADMGNGPEYVIFKIFIVAHLSWLINVFMHF